MFERPRTGERAVLVRLGLGAQVDPEDLQEFTQLAVSAGALPVATVTGRRERPDPRYFLGSGKAQELKGIAHESEADVILVDHALSPSQERNLESLTGRRVLDRNGLILDIFAQRARSFEGKLEVELAQLKHIATRLVRGWTHLERQKGGIGLRGPGETQLETDRRLIAQRVRVLTRRLARIQLQRDTVSPLAGAPVEYWMLAPSRAVLHERIARRFAAMMERGFLDEVARLREGGALTARHPSMRAVGYRQLWAHLEGKYPLEEARGRAVAATRQLARRQLTWMRGEALGRWIGPESELSWNRDICKTLAQLGL